ncbi:Ribosomal RNA small subunit methyltransferase E [Mesoplasma florum W37]|uniref:Ribosomal RNA small subunit methyltransferase E n=1 Tax=Mesoplasma florum TaxID=2151 RepID=A0AAD0HTB1_MESFO|nr:16S rRNA (uracil(1498)-N(3))-methyltransferase [Mesoplasma florum]AGY41390.1 Ribosomal RNA small subunit methyltransferase E [Mesoplasma florum W37]AVN59612.1 16S rRNA methyltransferase [Mesoplasma florum]AVN65730.1 Ribosomal RNA small subunit methyltransferase E [Mesoplasma florum]
MFRYFVEIKKDNYFIINNNDVHHIKNVVKLKNHEIIECVYKKEVYQTKIIDLTLEDTVVVEIINKIETTISNIKKVLIAGVLREQKWDYLLQKSTELGVDEIIPVIFKRNVVKIDEKKIDQKLQRWQAICDTAAKQAKRTTIPVVNNLITNLKDLKNNLCDLNLVAWEEEKNIKLKTYLTQDFNSISFIIGCEGGIDVSEIKILHEIGFKNVSLGNNILRAETAPVYVLSSLIYENK